tara:strand:- start:7715 stop:8953 length:1239 start_codon:yes stop_codon:yes gene_type:complete
MINFYYKLLYFLPLALISGPFFSDLIVITCSLFFLIDTFRLKLFNYYNNTFFKVFIIFFFFLNISSLFSEDIIAFKYTIGYLRYGIFSILIFYVLKNYSNFKKNFIFIFFFTFIFLIIDGYIQYFFGKNILFFDIEKYQTGLKYVTSVFGEEKKLGSYLSRLAPIFFIAILLLKKEFNINKDLINLFLIPVLYILILLTTERISIFLISSLLILMLFNSNELIKKKIIFLITFILSVILVLLLNPSLLEKLKSVFYSIGVVSPGYTSDGKIIGGYDQGLFFFSKFYHDQILNSLSLFKENIFFGIGAKNYKLQGFDGWHPHNFHAQLLGEIGLIGYLIFFSIFISFLSKVIKILFLEKNEKTNPDHELKNLLIFIVFLNLLPIPTSDFFNNWLNIILYLPFGFILFLNEKKI